MSDVVSMLAYANNHMMDWDQGGWFFMGLMMIIGTIIVVAVIFLLVKAFYQGSTGIRASDSEHALEIAKRRYASGEIDHDEYERMRQDLSQGG